MAQLRQVPIVLRAVGPIRFARNVWKQVQEDQVFTWAAALAYSWMFAIFPFLIFLLSLVPLLPERAKHEAYRDIERTVDKSLPTEAADLIKQQVNDLLAHPQNGLLSVGLLVTIWAAAGGTSMTMSALDRCYDIHPHKMRSYIKQRAIALLLTVVIATLVLIVLLLLPVGTELLRWLADRGIVYGWLWVGLNVVRVVVAIVLLVATLALIYHFGPSLKRRFVAFSPGAIFSLTVWVALGYAFRYYIDLFGAASYNRTYGTVGGVAILLLLFYLDALVLMIGAEINSEIDFAVVGLPSDHRQTSADLPALIDDPAHQALREHLAAKRAPHQLGPPAPTK